MREPAPFSMTAVDGYLLGATYYPTDDPRARIVMAGATGVAQRFYRHFAEYAAVRGYDVITFDYRGVGASASRKGASSRFRSCP